MSRVVDLGALNGDLAATVSQLLNFPETIDKFAFPSRSHHNHEQKGLSAIPTDIMDSPKEYIFYMDVPGLCKSDFQV